MCDERLIYLVNYNNSRRLWNGIEKYEEKTRRHIDMRHDAGNHTADHCHGKHHCFRTKNNR